ncbi:NUDIX domain-containing protein [Paludicola sp. MB14-C6]|uniref:NUDIX domain-containing protein n=1 Tax=Paludihabitans sp. MB14-C6 TaxID=3070656 RepID=UPI0027DB7B83|nr:NUDIX domain-containing protein [Paludicola sp. MB14-C6]WMJ23841.1 NUDIX domain-containing protein [Paludicola sp. MB14-C6]
MLQESFGVKQAGTYYKDRIGIYGIGFNQDLEIPIIKTPTGYFLLGGGLEQQESHGQCIQRECLEEAGLSVAVGDFICKGDKYHWSDTLEYSMHAIGYFYFIHSIYKVSAPTELDHELLWLSYSECIDKLFLDHQAWAVKIAYQKAVRNIK